MGQSLRCPLLRLHIQGRGDGLGDPGVQRRGPAGNDEVAVRLVARTGAAIAVTRPRADERGVCAE